MRTLLILAVFLFPATALAHPPNPVGTFETAKKKARNEVYHDHRITLYCACTYTNSSTASGGVIEPTVCGYTPRANAERGGILEWEHMMPAFEFGHIRSCWKEGHDSCKKLDGTRFKGRECCKKSGVDPEFRIMLADLHNLAPSVGELNGDRSNHPYGLVENDPRDYGACDFEVGGSPKVAEPKEDVRGDVARAWLYMSDGYSIRLSQEERAMFLQWHEADPPDEWERTRDERIEELQGNKNPFVRP